MSERDETTAEKLAGALRARADWLDLPRDAEAPRPYISREQFRAAANLLDEIERLREALREIADLTMGRGDGAAGDYVEEVGTIARAALKAPTP